MELANSSLYVGLMSGTSNDGIDAVLWDQARCQLLGSTYEPYTDGFRHQLAGLMFPGALQGDGDLIEGIGQIQIELTDLHVQAVQTLLHDNRLQPSDVRAIGFHGHTIRHRPHASRPFTWQIGDAHRLSAKTGITVVGDLRSRDVALGGQGAPLAPLFHKALWANPAETRAILNLGGISNVTVLPMGQNPFAFDIGPANALMDECMQRYFQKNFDSDGQTAASGQVIPDFLDRLLNHPYFQQKLPKSTGREVFNLDWAETLKPKQLKPEDFMATLLALTTESIAQVLRPISDLKQVFVCGGGAYNPVLIADLKKRLKSTTQVESTQNLGLAPEWVEACAFAWLASQALEGKPVNPQPFTGAREACILGAVYKI